VADKTRPEEREPRQLNGDGNYETSIYRIAAKTGTSTSTVSRVINNKPNVRQPTRLKILKAIEELNYVPRFMKRSSLNLGLLMQCEESMILGNYGVEILNGASETSMESDFNIILLSVNEQRMRRNGVLPILREKGIEGVLIIFGTNRTGLVEEFEREKYPYVILNHIPSGYPTNFVDINNETGMKKGLDYLYELGHRDIAFITGDLSNSDHQARYSAYQDFMRTKNLDPAGLAVLNTPEDDHQSSLDQGYHKTKRLLEIATPSAIMANNDDQAIGCLRALSERNLAVPEEISLIGLDDYPVSSFIVPSLTTIRQSLRQMGKIARINLVSLIHGTIQPHVQIRLDAELIVRNSTGPVNPRMRSG